MKYAGGLIRHLGLQMYSGAVPAIAELISNSWDADATTVKIAMPLGESIRPDMEIRVEDDGHGMTFDEVNDLYLMVGRNRRRTGRTFTDKGRPVLGRKGIGKLAGFGIARLMEVWTVREGWLTAFEMDYEVMTSGGTAETPESYQPPILHDRAVTEDDPIQKGTLVVLKRLQLKNAINADRFRQSMSRRFSILSAGFEVDLNGDPLLHQEVELQFRFPKEGEEEVDVPGVGTIRWWAGFTAKPIKVDESRGIAVLARGKLAQAPFYFELSGGMQGQHGLQYLTGEVHADALDEDLDLVATDRASVRWEDPRAEPLLEWGQEKVRSLLREWSKLRQGRQRDRLRDTTKYMERIARFPEREQREILKAIEALARIETIDDERLDELVDILVRAFENDHFMSIIRSLRDATEAQQGEIVELIEEWDLIEALAAAQQVRGRVELIRTFRRMIEQKAREKPDMQDYVRDHPWLLDASWEMMVHERALDTVLAQQFEVSPEPIDEDDGTGQRRLDFFVLGDSGTAVVVEVKRPGDLVGKAELEQLTDYVDYLRDWNEKSTGSRRKRARVIGCLVYSRMRDGMGSRVDRMRRDGIEVVTWEQLLETAERQHRDFLEVVKSRAPQDDPRLQAIPPIDDET